VAEQRRSERPLAVVVAGAVIGGVEVVLAVSFAAVVFGGYLVNYLANGIGLYLIAATVTLAIFAWRGGSRGIVGSVQDACAAVLGVVAINLVAVAKTSFDRVFLSVIATTLVVTLLTGIAFLVLGRFRLGNLVRFVPYPVVGGFLAGTGWLLIKAGIGVAASKTLSMEAFARGDFFHWFEIVRWVPALGFGIVLVMATRVVRRPLVFPLVLALGFVVFILGMLVTRSSVNDALNGGWMLGPFESGRLIQPWTLRALTGADWVAVGAQTVGILTAVFVAVVACLFNVSGIELMLRTDLDSNRELRDVGLVNVVSSLVGGIPGYHAISLTSLAERLNVSARSAGLVAAVVPVTAVALGPRVVAMIPRMIVGGVLVFVGLSFIVEWVVDIRRSLPVPEFLIVLAILGMVVWKGLLPGVELGLVLAVALFAVNYSRIELVRDAEFGLTYRSNVDRPAAERAALSEQAAQVHILRVNGFVFFGTASGLLERIRARVQRRSLRFLVIDLGRVTGMDSSAVLSFRKVRQLAEANGFEVVFCGVSDPVMLPLRRGGVVAADGTVRFEPDLDRALQRCEDGLLATEGLTVAEHGDGRSDGLPTGLSAYAEQRTLEIGAPLLRQGDPPDDVFVLQSGRLTVEVTTPEGKRIRLRSVLPGVVVGEVAMYTGTPRTADVVAETPSVVLRLSRDAIERLEARDPELAAAVHRWLATTLAERLTDTLRAFDGLMD
jgi:sulfate permease, SulP family